MWQRGLGGTSLAPAENYIAKKQIDKDNTFPNTIYTLQAGKLVKELNVTVLESFNSGISFAVGNGTDNEKYMKFSELTPQNFGDVFHNNLFFVAESNENIILSLQGTITTGVLQVILT